MIWDMRKSTCPIIELAHPNKRDNPVTQITNSNLSFETIISGYSNGDLASFSSNSSDTNYWVLLIYLSAFNNYRLRFPMNTYEVLGNLF